MLMPLSSATRDVAVRAQTKSFVLKTGVQKKG